MTRVNYEALCPVGHRISVAAKETARRLIDAIRILQDSEEHYPEHVARYRTEVKDLKAERDQSDLTLSRHVAHCSDGCVRAKGGVSFAGEARAGVFDRSPAHRKPPLPAASELAAMLRDGQTIDDVGARYERHPHTIRQRLLHAGYSGVTGERQAPMPIEVDLTPGRLDDQPWAGDALCAQTDPESFFPERGESTRAAKRVCAGCLVAAECLDYALTHRIRFGVWGGLSERERRKIVGALEPGDAA